MNRTIAVDYAISKGKYEEYIKSTQQKNEKQKKRKREEESESEENKEESEEESEESEENENEEDEEIESDESEENESEEEEEESGEDMDEDYESEEVDDEDEEMRESNDEENKEKAENPIIQDDPDIKKGSVLFVRNLQLSTTRATILEKYAFHFLFSNSNFKLNLEIFRMKEYGEVTGVFIVKNPESGLSRGSAFVHFQDTQSVNKILRKAYSNLGKIKSPGLFDNFFFVNNNFISIFFKKKESINAESNITLDGRNLILSKAVDRIQAKNFKKLKEKNMDKRNLHLANEGLIKRDSPAAKELSKEDLAKRERAQKDKKKKLQNPNYHVSRVRLAIRNLPKYLSDKDLKEVFKKAATDPSLPPPKIHQAKVLKEMDKKGNLTNRSKGIAFVEFTQHEHALLALRNTNNNPDLFGNDHRLIVEFALDNVQKLKKRKEMLEKIKKKPSENSSEDIKKEKKRERTRRNKKKKKELKKQEKTQKNPIEPKKSTQPTEKSTKFNEKPTSVPSQSIVKSKAKIPIKPPKKKRKNDASSDKFDKLVSEYKEKYFSSRPAKKWFEE